RGRSGRHFFPALWGRRNSCKTNSHAHPFTHREKTRRPGAERRGNRLSHLWIHPRRDRGLPNERLGDGGFFSRNDGGGNAASHQVHDGERAHPRLPGGFATESRQTF